jgi:hypothetical protein
MIAHTGFLIFARPVLIEKKDEEGQQLLNETNDSEPSD